MLHCLQGDWDSAKAVGTGEYEELECGLVIIFEDIMHVLPTVTCNHVHN